MHGEATASDFFSLSWWTGVVLVALLIHVAGGFLHGLLDAIVRRWSSRWRTRSQAKQEAFVREISALRGNLAEQQMQATILLTLMVAGFAVIFFGLMSVFAEEFRRQFPTSWMKQYPWVGPYYFWFTKIAGGSSVVLGLLLIGRAAPIAMRLLVCRRGQSGA